MNINIKAKNLDLTPSLKNYIEIKLGPLTKFFKDFDAEGSFGVWMEVGRMTKHHKKGIVYVARADLRLPGKILRAEEQSHDLRGAIDILKDKLRAEASRYAARLKEKKSVRR